MKKIVLSICILVGSAVAVDLGKVPNPVTIEGDNGGKLDGSAWKSSMLHGKVYTLFYVDPDKKELNQDLANALKAKNYDRSKVNSVAIINLAATWIPNMVLEKILAKKQKEFPHTIYVKDKKKVLVKKWKLEDDNSDILIFNQKGELIYKKFGKLSSLEIKEVLKLIEKQL